MPSICKLKCSLYYTKMTCKTFANYSFMLALPNEGDMSIMGTLMYTRFTI